MPNVSKLYRRLFSAGCPPSLHLCQTAAVLTIVAALSSTGLLGQEGVPLEKPDEPIIDNSQPKPSPARTFEESNGYQAVELTPYLSVVVHSEISDADWMPSHDREELKSHLVAQVHRLTEQQIDPEKTRIISFVQDKETSTVVANSGIKRFLIDEPIASLSDLEHVLKNNDQNFLIFVGHVDEDQRQFGGFPIDKLREATNRVGALALFLGCNTEASFGSGTTDDVNSVQVMQGLSKALGTNTLGAFLTALTGPDLHLRINLSLLNAVAHQLEMSLVDKHDVVRATISLQGFTQLADTPPQPRNRLSLLSRFLHISYAMLMSIFCSAVVVVLWLLAGVAFPSTLPLRSELWWSTRWLGNTALAFTLTVVLTACSLALMLLSIVPFFWFPPLALIPAGIIYGYTRVTLEAGFGYLKTHPRRLELAAGLTSLCVFGTMFGTYLLS
jgi:hypothetical protein